MKNPDPERTARARLVSAPFSTKQGIEICSALRGKPLDRAMALLEEVMSLKTAIPFKRFNKDMGHKVGMAAGRYPVKASKHILELLKSVNSNAQEKGFATSDLVVSHISAKRASRPWHAGRHVRRKAKRTHVEILVEQRAAEEKVPKKSKDKRAKRTQQKEEKSATDLQAVRSEAAKKSTETKPETKPEAEKKAEPKNKLEAPKQKQSQKQEKEKKE